MISHPLSTVERISLITAIFSDRNEVEVVGNLSGCDAQAFVDVINEVSIYTLQRMGRSVPTKTSVPRRPGVGWPPATGPQEVFALSIQTLCPSSAASEIAANPALLQVNGDSAVPWWLCGCMEGST